MATFTGFVQDGKVQLDDKAAYRTYLHELDGHEVQIEIKRRQHKRSLDQNAYWWAEPVARLAEHCGYTPAQMHYALLGECFGYTTGPLGQAVPIKPSSSELTVAEFSQLIDWVLTWAPSELGVELMPPSVWQESAA